MRLEHKLAFEGIIFERQAPLPGGKRLNPCLVFTDLHRGLVTYSIRSVRKGEPVLAYGSIIQASTASGKNSRFTLSHHTLPASNGNIDGTPGDPRTNASFQKMMDEGIAGALASSGRVDPTKSVKCNVCVDRIGEKMITLDDSLGFIVMYANTDIQAGEELFWDYYWGAAGRGNRLYSNEQVEKLIGMQAKPIGNHIRQMIRKHVEGGRP